jgi:Bacterial regulatory proteins, gntR family
MPAHAKYKDIADRLREEVRSLPAGDRLPSEVELKVRYGVAQTTMRKALQLLLGEGLIALSRGQGAVTYYVRKGPPQAQSADTLFDAADLACGMTPDINGKGEAMTSISVPAGRLRDMLTVVLPHAGTDDDLPVLTAVRFEARSGTLFLVATDRYTMGAARCEIPGAAAAPPGDADCSLHAENARLILSMLKHVTGVAALAFGDGRLTLDTGDGNTAGWPAAGGKFPDWRRTLAGMLPANTSPADASLGLNPLHLAKFAIPLGTESVEYTDGPVILTARLRDGGKPVLLAARGDWFIGAAMPVRSADPAEPQRSDPWEQWTAILAAAPEKAGEAVST